MRYSTKAPWLFYARQMAASSFFLYVSERFGTGFSIGLRNFHRQVTAFPWVPFIFELTLRESALPREE